MAVLADNRLKLNDQLQSDPSKRDRWAYRTFGTYGYYYASWNEVQIPAGMIQVIDNIITGPCRNDSGNM